MMDRKKKLRFIQLFLLIVGLSLIYLTYYNKEVSNNKGIVSKNLKDSVESKAKRKGKAAGKQFVKQPKNIAKKTRSYRKVT